MNLEIACKEEQVVAPSLFVSTFVAITVPEELTEGMQPF